MVTRRDFLKSAALLSGAGLSLDLFDPIEKAMAISPHHGSSYLDAEHIVILMQENRSFDHCYGSLRGVRGFADPRAMILEHGLPVWLQTQGAKGEGKGSLPFRLNIKDTQATWMGSLPHSWPNQVDARNQGHHDRWCSAKKPENEQYGTMPLTLGYYDRNDLPFYYALADAFTVCDQYFSSALTGTTPNRLYLWTGTIREKPTPDSPANVYNSDVDYGKEANWKTFPERLEEQGISWKIYQNEISLNTGFKGEEDSWLSNFTDNPLEWFSQYQVKFSPAHQHFLSQLCKTLETDLSKENQDLLVKIREEQRKWSQKNFDRLPPFARNLHQKAFSTNQGDPLYRKLETLTYHEGSSQREMLVPAGDILHQFRQDVAQKKLPTVSWVVAPANFSDHPGHPWFGSWYVSEMLKILTDDPETWKKTIFMMTYDENDGYFDHIPPFVPPHPHLPRTGLVSPGIDVGIEYVLHHQEKGRRQPEHIRESPIGLGYRVPMVIASPWTRGGCVCSQVFDHTSPLQFLEKFLTHKTGKPVEETQISAWRRTVCGDLTSAFRQAGTEPLSPLPSLQRNEFLEEIHRAKLKDLPRGYREFSPQEIKNLRQHPKALKNILPQQEEGIRPSAPLPYQLTVDGSLSKDQRRFGIRLEAKTAGSPFIIHGNGRIRNYAVSPGGHLEDFWGLYGQEEGDFQEGKYQLKVHGPNGFFREFTGSSLDPHLEIRTRYSPQQGMVLVNFQNHHGKATYHITIQDLSYKTGEWTLAITPGEKKTQIIPTARSFHWYDFSVQVEGDPRFRQQFAGRMETGQWGMSDPAMGIRGGVKLL